MTPPRAARFLAGAAVVIFAGGLAPARGQLGESPADIARIYGRPVQQHARVREHQIIGGPAVAGDVHQKDGCFVRVVYSGDRVVQAEFSPCEGDLTRSQVEALLAGAAEGSRWQPTPGGDERLRFYRRLDGEALASWTIGANGSLLIAAEHRAGQWQKLLLDGR